MNRMYYTIVIVLLLLAAPAASFAQNGQKVVTLGADLTPEQRSEVVKILGANESTDKVITISADEMRSAMQNILPVPEGYISVSSTALNCVAPGSGLRVTTTNITRVSAAMYAGALITAGIGDAEFVVAAPNGAQAEGMTGLTGLFKGMQGGVCGRGEIDPNRRDLAYRQLALTADIAANGTNGDLTKASELVMRAQQSLVEQKNNADQAEPIADKVQADLGITLGQEQKAALVQLLGDMGRANIDWGNYAVGWDIENTSDAAVSVKPRNADGAGGSNANSITGTVKTAIAGNTLNLDVAGQNREFNAENVPVTRDGQPATLAAIQPNDSVTVEVDAAGKPTKISAVGAKTSAAPANSGRTLTGIVTSGITNNMLSIKVNDQEQQFTPAANVSVTRDGKPAQISDIQANDNVSIDVDANNQVNAIRATSRATSGFGLARFWWLCLLPLIPLLLLLLRRRRKEPVAVVEPTTGRTTVYQKGDNQPLDGAVRSDVIKKDNDLG